MSRTRKGDGRTDGKPDGRTDGQGGDYMLISGSIKISEDKFCPAQGFNEQPPEYKSDTYPTEPSGR
jgi:hypothetical protein